MIVPMRKSTPAGIFKHFESLPLAIKGDGLKETGFTR
jgi:hypothetical protein